ncbi:EsaB/YukD family protein [Micromonospora rubida]|uniref:EsaB/YukD family protein n=1 Tax=Micromonospora rubida TaxID=2697657 RepID=UPI001376628B|nr:EsaB/YukD family protein [Micromonospora rubida]NBE80097.1 hypothetical protein [Micromonospora rubida]
MLDRRSRVTVNGGGKRVDVALPSESPIGEYVAGLAELCGQTGGGLMAPAWSLAPAGGAPFSIESSLAEAGVADGQVLYLRDVARDPGTAPVVEDIEELVAADAQEQRVDARARGVLTVWIGAGWLTLVAAVVAARPHRNDLLAALGLVLVSIVVLCLGWVLNQKRARLPASACLAISLSAVPCLAAAGGLVGQSLGGGLFWCGVVLGANAGLLMALAATPEPAILAAEAALALAGTFAVVLVFLDADGTQIAAATVLAALLLVAVARPLAAAVAAWSTPMPKAAAGVAPATARLMLNARQLLALILVFPALALAGAFPVLALSRQGWSVGLAAVAGAALVIRARQVGFVSEVVLLAVPGAIGLFSVIGASGYRYLASGPSVLVLLLIGAAVVGVGVAVALASRPRAAAKEDGQTPFGPVVDTRDRGKFVETIGVVCLVLSATLALGVFGVFTELFTMGREMVG